MPINRSLVAAFPYPQPLQPFPPAHRTGHSMSPVRRKPRPPDEASQQCHAQHAMQLGSLPASPYVAPADTAHPPQPRAEVPQALVGILQEVCDAAVANIVRATQELHWEPCMKSGVRHRSHALHVGGYWAGRCPRKVGHVEEQGVSIRSCNLAGSLSPCSTSQSKVGGLSSSPTHLPSITLRQAGDCWSQETRLVL